MSFAKRKLIGFTQQLTGNFYYSMLDESLNALSEGQRKGSGKNVPEQLMCVLNS